MSFESLGVPSALVRALTQHGITQPTPVQTAALPPALNGQDVRVQAPTGSGKTVAYALPLLAQLIASRLSRPRRTQALVLLPTRELAAQVGELIAELARHLNVPLKVVVLCGGVSINPQLMGLRGGADIVVATPGRLLDVVDHNALRLSDVGFLVLDEADRLLDLGFADELRRIQGLLRPASAAGQTQAGRASRQTLLCSATFPADVQDLSARWQVRPVEVALQHEPTPAPLIHQRAIEVDPEQRTLLLRHLVESNPVDRMLVFVASTYTAELVAHKLARAGLVAAPFHGDMSQGARTRTLKAFRDCELQVLVATDVAARGLDVPELPYVINYDLARSPVDHTHRIGRTGRAGAAGEAISFVSPATEAHFRLIEKRQGQRVPRELVPGFEPKAPVAAASPLVDPGTQGGIKGRRKSKKDKLREAAAAQGAVRT